MSHIKRGVSAASGLFCVFISVLGLFCRLVENSVRCLNATSDCGAEDTRKLMSDFLSFAFTIYKLGDERMAGINPHNVYNALTCISEGGETDNLQASKELVQLFTC